MADVSHVGFVLRQWTTIDDLGLVGWSSNFDLIGFTGSEILQFLILA